MILPFTLLAVLRPVFLRLAELEGLQDLLQSLLKERGIQVFRHRVFLGYENLSVCALHSTNTSLPPAAPTVATAAAFALRSCAPLLLTSDATGICLPFAAAEDCAE